MAAGTLSDHTFNRRTVFSMVRSAALGEVVLRGVTDLSHENIEKMLRNEKHSDRVTVLYGGQEIKFARGTGRHVPVVFEERYVRIGVSNLWEHIGCKKGIDTDHITPLPA